MSKNNSRYIKNHKNRSNETNNENLHFNRFSINIFAIVSYSYENIQVWILKTYTVT